MALTPTSVSGLFLYLFLIKKNGIFHKFLYRNFDIQEITLTSIPKNVKLPTARMPCVIQQENRREGVERNTPDVKTGNCPDIPL